MSEAPAPPGEEVHVAFTDLATTYAVARRLLPAREDEVQTASANEYALYTALAKRIGRVGTVFTKHFPSVVWYADKPLRIYYAGSPPESVPSDLTALLADLEALEESGRSLLDGRNLRRLLDAIFSAFTDATVTADQFAANASASLTSRMLASSQRSARHARLIFDAITQREAQLTYFYGMLAGAAVLVVTSTLLGLAGPFLPRADVDAVDIVSGCIYGGSLGAIFSVLSRMHSGSLRLTPDAGAKLLLILGAVRPVVGAVAGIALFLFIDGEALDILSRPEESARPYSFYAGLAFLAGFSERWFQDMLAARAPAADRAATADDRTRAADVATAAPGPTPHAASTVTPEPALQEVPAGEGDSAVAREARAGEGEAAVEHEAPAEGEAADEHEAPAEGEAAEVVRRLDRDTERPQQ